MKLSFKKTIVWVLAIVVIAVVLIQPSTQRGKYVYDVQTISKTCNFDEFAQQDIRTQRNSIIITMPIQTPTPCYDVEGTVTSFGSDIQVNLKTTKSSDVCAECVGTVVARVTISNLDKGNYGLQVNTPDKSIITTATIE